MVVAMDGLSLAQSVKRSFNQHYGLCGSSEHYLLLHLPSMRLPSSPNSQA